MWVLTHRTTGRMFSARLRTLDLRKFAVVTPNRAKGHMNDKRPSPPVMGRPSDVYGNVVVSLPYLESVYGEPSR